MAETCQMHLFVSVSSVDIIGLLSWMYTEPKKETYKIISINFQ